jgi:WD40 repeat protein
MKLPRFSPRISGALLFLLLSVLLAYPGCQASNSSTRTTSNPYEAAEQLAGDKLPPWRIYAICAAVTPDGKLALVRYSGDGPLPRGKFDQWVKLWDVQSGKAIGTLAGYTAPVVFLTLLSDGTTVVGGDRDGVLHFHEIPSCKLLRSLRVCPGCLFGGVLSPDGRLALTLGYSEKAEQINALKEDGKTKAQVWDLSHDKLVQTLDVGPRPMHVFAISPDHRLALVGCKHDGKTEQMTSFAIETGKAVKQLPFSGYFGHGGSEQFASDSKRLLVGGILFDIGTGKVVWGSPMPAFSWGHFLQDERLVLGMDRENNFHLLDAATGKELRSIDMDLGILPDRFAPGGKIRATSIGGAFTADGLVFVGAVGQNVRPDSQLQDSNLTIQVWRLGRRPGLLKSWRDSTQPEWP